MLQISPSKLWHIMIHFSPIVTAYGTSCIEQAGKQITLNISHLSSILSRASDYHKKTDRLLNGIREKRQLNIHYDKPLPKQYLVLYVLLFSACYIINLYTTNKFFNWLNLLAVSMRTAIFSAP